MATCSKCGFDVDPGPIPQRCPRCGAQMGIGAPPPFAQGAASAQFRPGPPGSTLFGLPDVEQDIDSLDAAHPRPDAPRTAGNERSFIGPPPIELDFDGLDEDEDTSTARHNELDLTSVAPISTSAEPETRHGELDFSAFDEDDGAAIDLPAPSTRTGDRDARREQSEGDDERSQPFGLAQVRGNAGLFDDLDLPAPAQRDRAARPQRDLPASARPPSLKRPGPRPQPGKGARAPVPPPQRDDGPLDFTLEEMVDAVDLPMPADLDLPAPAAPADLPTPVDANLPAPSAMELRPRERVDAPTQTQHESEASATKPATIEPRERPDARNEPKVDTAGLAQASAQAQAATLEALVSRRSPEPKAPPRRPIPRRALWLGGGLVTVALGGAAVLHLGLLDPADDPADAVTRGGVQTPHEGPAAVSSGRTESFLTALHADTPQSYLQAIEEAQSKGDPLAEAEASLLLHLRYGPEPVLAGKASALLKPYADNPEPHVRRVVGLDALADNRLGDAERLLVGDDTRTTLYRAFLRMRQQLARDALADADAVLASNAADLAAMALRHEARLAFEPTGVLDAIEESIAAHPEHPALREVAVRAAQTTGFLVRARQHAQSLVDLVDQHGADEFGKHHRARVYSLQARVLSVSGRHAPALALHVSALELAPRDLSLRLERVRALLDAKELAQATAEINGVIDTHPDDFETALLHAEVSIAAGKDESALRALAELDAIRPDDARVAYLLGEAYALTLAIDEAQDAYATARARDSHFSPAAIGEARMLVQAKRPLDAIAVLDAALQRSTATPAESARRDFNAAALLLEKARLLISQGDDHAARAVLDEASQAKPHDNDVQLARGLLRLRLGDLEGGRADLMAVYERTGSYPGLTGPLGRLLAADGNVTELEALVGEYLDDRDLAVEVKLVGARLRLLQGRIDDARLLIEQSLAREPSSWEAQLLLAEMLLEAGDPAAALKEIGRVRPPAPSAELHLLKGQILEYNNRHDEARPEYLAALEIDPHMHEARMWHGRLLALKGANKKAIEELRKVTDATGDAFPRAWLNLGRAQRGLGEHQAALESLRKASSLDPTLFEAFYIEGRLHADQNRHTQAIEAFERAVVEDAADEWWYTNALIDFGRSLAKAGHNKRAVVTFEQFLRLAPPGHASRGEAKRQLESLR